MLNVFPELLFLAPLAALLIRAAAASAFVLAALVHWKHSHDMIIKNLSIFEFIIAIALAVGFYTQIAALLAIILIAVWLFIEKFRPLPISTILLLLVMNISLLLTGSGPISFDLPL
jgi:uncharacterized membrane protein YphA (DoxX/SURF4 family)